MSQPSPQNEWQPCETGTIGRMLDFQAAKKLHRLMMATMAVSAVIAISMWSIVLLTSNSGGDSTSSNPLANVGFDPYSYVNEVNCQKAFEALKRFEADNKTLDDLPENFVKHIKRCQKCEKKYNEHLSLHSQDEI